MSLTKFTESVNNIQSLPDKPTLDASKLKAMFDKAGVDIKTYLNTILTDEIDELIASKELLLKSLINSTEADLTTTLNKEVEDIINMINDKNIITAYPEVEFTEITQSDQVVVLDGHDVVGEKLTVQNNAIKIGKEISKVLISAQIFYQNYSIGNGYLFPKININGKTVARAIRATTVNGGSSYETVNISEFLINVTEGDLITLSTGEVVGGDEKGKYRGIQIQEETKRRNTYITVKAVE